MRDRVCYNAYIKEDGIRIQRTIAQAIEQHDPHQAREAAQAYMRHIGRLLDVS